VNTDTCKHGQFSYCNRCEEEERQILETKRRAFYATSASPFELYMIALLEKIWSATEQGAAASRSAAGSAAAIHQHQRDPNDGAAGW
jgi:hypothetical protein